MVLTTFIGRRGAMCFPWCQARNLSESAAADHHGKDRAPCSTNQNVKRRPS